MPANEDSNSLTFYFDSEVVPFDEAVTYLNDLKEIPGGLSWYRMKPNGYRRPKYRLDKAFDVSLTSQFHCIEVEVTKVEGASPNMLVPEACIIVRETIEKKLNAHKLVYHLAFKCTCKQSKEEHLMKVIKSESGSPINAECLKEPLQQQLSKESHLIWFVS